MPDGGTGEYMVRLYLFSRQNELAATWRPGGASDAPQKLFDYAVPRFRLPFHYTSKRQARLPRGARVLAHRVGSDLLGLDRR